MTSANSILIKARQMRAIEDFRWQPTDMGQDLNYNSNNTADFPAGSASVLIIENEGLILAVSRKNNHSDLGLPGGKIESGESPISAACREAVEELGATVCNPILVKVAKVDDINVFIYRADVIGDVVDHVNTEGARVRWVEPKAICSGTFGKFNKKHIMPFVVT